MPSDLQTGGSQVVQVVPDIAAPKILDYVAPAHVEIGDCVRIPLGSRTVDGWIVAKGSSVGLRQEALKQVGATRPGRMPVELVEVAEWAARVYCTTWRTMLRVASEMAPRAGAPIHSAPTLESQSNHRVTLHVWSPGRPRLELVRALLADTGSTLILVPNRRDAERLAHQLTEPGGLRREVVLWNPMGSAASRREAWMVASAGNAVVVGTRSAIWAPIPDLQAVALLDEHDESYQSEAHPTWHARTVAIARAQRHGAVVHLVSGTPSVESLVIASPEVRTESPAQASAGWAEVATVDPREIPSRERPIASTMLDWIRPKIAESAVLVVRNELGGVVLVACHECGELQRCPVCGSATRLEESRLICGHGHWESPECSSCGGQVFRALRRGTGGLRDVLATLLPRVEVSEVTRKHADRIELGKNQIAVGTEALLHRARGPISGVLFLDFDRELLAPRIRAAEQSMALLGRASRILRGKLGSVLIETRFADHPIVAAARVGNPLPVIAYEREVREGAALPPFGQLAELKQLEVAPEEHAAIREQCERLGARLLGPNRDGRWRVQAPLEADLAPVMTYLRTQSPRVRVWIDPLRV